MCSRLDPATAYASAVTEEGIRTSAPPQPLPGVWKKRLDLRRREPPEFYEDATAVRYSTHASAIRTALAELGASAVFCVQDVPTVVIVVLNRYDQDYIIDLHRALWNQGLATLLLVVSGDTLRVFSLARIPLLERDAFHERCLVLALDAAKDAIAIKDIIYGVESGRIWNKHDQFFKPSERIDHVLLDNLTACCKELTGPELPLASAQALLLQTMFIAYLEHREIIGSEYFYEASRGDEETFVGILCKSSPAALFRLFTKLQRDFNGDLFAAPCSFDSDAIQPHVDESHLETLARFVSGREEMAEGSGQLRFWGYDFRYIPIELISAVYNRFLGEHQEERRQQGAYYTPMFLADTVVTALWESMATQTRTTGQVLDPACGSGIFLVRVFQLLCEHWKLTHKLRTIPWRSLLDILFRVHGFDVSHRAARVAVFSLYLALLQEVKPPAIRSLIKQGRLLPKLWNRTIHVQDFFAVRSDEYQADVILGNPPWSSRRGLARPPARWSRERQLPTPGREDAWAFVWKALRHLRGHGVVAFLLPAMGFLHNHSSSAIEARRRLFRIARVFRIVNFSDMRYQLFEGAIRPAALMMFGHGQDGEIGYLVDYWTPKASPTLNAKRVIALNSIDKKTITSNEVQTQPSIFTRHLWMSGPESKLFRYLASLPSVRDYVSEYRSHYRSGKFPDDKWVIGHGFKPAQSHRLHEDGYRYQYSETVATLPYLPIKTFRVLAQNCESLQPFEHNVVHRRGFEHAFNGPRVLVPRGIRISKRRLRATYLEGPATFQHIMLAILVPSGDVGRAKLLTALLNSKLLFWYAFHSMASLGAERAALQQAEFLSLPFPRPHHIQQSRQAEGAAADLESLVDEATKSTMDNRKLRFDSDALLSDVDILCYRYFGLRDDEIALVEDTVDEVIPSVQPRIGVSVKLWKAPDRSDRQAYAQVLAEALQQWLNEDVGIRVLLEAQNEDLALLHLQLVARSRVEPYREQDNQAIGDALGRLSSRVDSALPGNFQLVPDFRLFIGRSLYVIKPLQRRFWLRSSGIADADAIAMELHRSVDLGRSI